MVDVSFVVPVYGVEKYIDKCVQSILEQTWRDFELILVDDGSPDNCPQICDAYAEQDSRITVIHKKNGGVSAARNDGIKAASGRWLYFVDSDDWIEPNAVELLLQKANSTGADCVFSDPYVQYSNRTVRGNMFSHEFYTEDKTVIEGIQKYMLCPRCNPFYTPQYTVGVAAPWCKFVRTRVIKENDIFFDPYVLGRFDDGLWSLHMLDKIKSVAYLMEATYNYRITGTSICYSFKPNAMEILERGFERTAEFINTTKKDKSFLLASYARICRYFALELSQYFFSDDNPKATKDVERELRGLMKREPYKTALQKVDMNLLDLKHRVVVLFARRQLVFPLKAYAYLKKIKQ